MAEYKANRDTDANIAGGIASGGAVSVLINGLKAGIPNMSVSSHAPCPFPVIHCAAKTVSTCESVLYEGKKALRTSADSDDCSHPRADGSDDVLIGT